MQHKTENNIFEINSDTDGQRIDNFLLKTLKDLSKSNIYKLLRKGQIRINGKRSKPTTRLTVGDLVRVPPFVLGENQELFISENLLKAVRDSIIFSNNNFLVVNKPSGLAVHSGTGVKVGLIEVCKELYPDTEIQLAHRLDRETSGCVVLAKNRQALNDFNQQSKDNNITKKYLALVKGVIKNNFEVELPLDVTTRSGGERTVTVSEDGKYAKTLFRVSEFYQRQIKSTLLECQLVTGRTHQIRVHAAAMEHPLAGDIRYGDEKYNQKLRKLGLKRLFLHASSIEFTDEDEKIIVSAELPEKLHKILSEL